MKFRLIEAISALFWTKTRAIEKDPLSVVLLDNPPEKLLSAAVSKDSRVFLLLKNPSENTSRIAIEKNPSCIRFISNPSERLQLQAVSKDPSQIGFIKNPCLKAQIMAVSSSPESIRLMDNPSVETVKLYIGNDYSRLWTLDLSQDKQEHLFNDIFRSGKESWNMTNDELTSWLSSFTKKDKEYVKEVFNAVKESSLNSDKLSPQQWSELLETGKCAVGRKELSLSGKPGSYSVSIINKSRENPAAESNKETFIMPPVKEKPLVTEGTANVAEEVITKEETLTPKQEYLRECLKGTKKKINEAVLLDSLKENKLSLKDMSNEQISSLIKKGETSVNGKTVKMVKTPSGYKIKTAEMQSGQENQILKAQNLELQESSESIKDLKLSDKQLKEIEKKGVLKLSGGKLIKQVQTPVGYGLKVYNIVNTLTRQGQAEA
jgi:hypothetical protein